MKRVLITFAGGTGGRGVAASLRAANESIHIIGVDAEKFSLQRSIADERFLVPKADEPDYLPILRQVVARTAPDLIWPTHDAEVAMVASDPELARLAFLPAFSVIELCQDKARAADVFRSAGVPIPDSRVITNEHDLKMAFEVFGSDIWIRMARGAGGKGATPVSDLETARMWIDLHAGWGRFTAAPNIRGSRLNCETVWYEGELVAAQGNDYVMAELGSLTRSGITGVSRANQWNGDADLVEIARQAVLAATPQPHGIFSVDTLRDADGNLFVTEINAGRFSNGGITHSLMHGINISHEVVKLALQDLSATSFPLINPMPTNYLMIRGIDLEQFEVPCEEVDAPEHLFNEMRSSVQR